MMRIAFVGNNNPNFFTKLIMWFSNSKFSHCMLILDETLDGDSIILESSLNHGVGLNVLSHYNGRPIEIFQDINDDWNINSIKPYIGDFYAYFQLLGIALVKIFKLKKNPFTSDEVCSEFVLDWLLGSPYAVEFQHLNRNTVTPEDIYEIISKSPSFKKIN